MNTDPISDLLTRIRNASIASKESVSIPYSNMKNEIVKIMKKTGYIQDIKIEKIGKFRQISLTLPKTAEKLHLKRISKPGQRIYVKRSEIPRILNGLGIAIISTPKGLMTDNEARKENVGGELLCEIY
ncbi:MAG: 30S ribosomal protein S8 [Patescibacteria group bacterium]|nr:30S ribosomal protein S8 [Patescibacteria group bacterium]